MIAACVESCLQQTRLADQILIINDGSRDRTGSIVAKFGDRITFVTIPEATGNKSRAQQLGLQFVTGEIFIATDADTILHPRFVEYIENAFQEHSEAAAVAGYVESTRHNYLTALREIDYVIGQDLYKQAQSFVNYVMVIPGCAGGFKTKIFRDNTITFDHDTLTEDLDFTYKLHQQNKLVYFEPRAIVYTQDPHTLNSYINQMRRWYGGGWQNLKKHWRVVFHSPGAALQLSLGYIEGMVFALLFFVFPLINIILFTQLLVFYFCISIISGMYASVRRNRADLLLYSPLIPFMRALNTYVFLEQFILEIILSRPNMTWFSPERRGHNS
jgi:cellulose synthase/poly-beta-1,6-N-acetylglucosamine synthase-like glycosyltransferase